MPGLVSTFMQRLHAPVYAARLRVLAGLIAPHLREGDRLLDVGCGNGTLALAIGGAPGGPGGLELTGLERFARGGEPIDVVAYEGGAFPFDDDAFDVVTIADVLHHEREPDELLRECARVSSRLVIVKDHARHGPLAQQRIALIDWAANAPYGVECLYRYNTRREWRALFERLGLPIAEEHASIDLYPPVVNALAGRSLQYLAVLDASARDAIARSNGATTPRDASDSGAPQPAGPT